MMNGIDVSHHQGKIDWKSVAKSVQFAVIRSSHGKHETDRCWEQNYAAARLAGIPIGAYHYFYYGNKKAFDEELQNFLAHLKGKHFDLPVFLDFEEEDKKYDPPLGAVDRVTLTNWAIEAFEKIRAAGLRPGIYANAYWMRKKLDMFAIPKDVCIWCADINGAIDYTGRVDIHQYDFYGKVDGIAGSGVDLDRSLCTDAFLLGKPTAEPCLFAIKVVKDTYVRDKPNGKKIEVAKAADNLTLGISEVSGTWGRIQNQPAAWISVNPKYTGVIRI
jgi:GH25 family lysozyme M1 (1,4-beta-N-acetylmuramidase)